MKAFILAAGFGTRLRPFTDHHPKALAMVNGQSLLERNIRNLQRFGIFDIVVNVHHFAGQIIETIEKNKGFGSRVSISDESDTVLETGGGLKKAIPLLRDVEPVLMMNVDILSDFNLDKMRAQHRQTLALATLAVQWRDSSRVLLFDGDKRLQGWKNLNTGALKPADFNPTQPLNAFCFSGIQMLSQDFFDKIAQDGKFSIMDTYLDLCKTEKIIAWNHTDDLWIDAGKPESLRKAAELFKP